MQALCLRFGQVISAEEAASSPHDPRWLHQEDAVQGIRCALAFELSDGIEHRWRIFHITAAGERAKIRLGEAGSKEFGYQPKHAFHPDTSKLYPKIVDEPTSFSGNIPIRRVVICGAGGPVAAVLAQELASSYTLRLTDVRPIADIAAEA